MSNSSFIYGLSRLTPQGFRARFLSLYDNFYKAVRHLPTVAALPLGCREKASCLLLAAIQATMRDMSDAVDRSVSLNPLRRALHAALLAREVSFATAPTTARAMAAQVC